MALPGQHARARHLHDLGPEPQVAFGRGEAAQRRVRQPRLVPGGRGVVAGEERDDAVVTERDRGAELQMYVVEEPKVRHFPHGLGELVLGRLGDEVVLDFVEDGQRERALERDRARRARLDELAVEGLELVMRDRPPAVVHDIHHLGRRSHQK